jgi:hypothetical protein
MLEGGGSVVGQLALMHRLVVLVLERLGRAAGSITKPSSRVATKKKKRKKGTA